MKKIHTCITIALVIFAMNLSAVEKEVEQPERFLLLATTRTGTMQKELNEAGARGYRFVGTQGGATAFGGKEVVVIMALDPEGRRYRYILLATSRTGTMQKELNEAPPEYEYAGMTVFKSSFGGSETAVILQGRGKGRVSKAETG